MKFGVMSNEFGVNSKNILSHCAAVLLLVIAMQTTVFCADKWPGVDEAVVEKIAKEQGREARAPFINSDQGDLLLFAFLLAGTVGGFVAGYYWRVLMSEKADKINKEE